MDINTITRESTTEIRKSCSDFKNQNECARQVKHNLLAVTDILKCGRVDASRPCSARNGDTCWLLHNLRPWNDILHLVDLEVKEECPGKVILRSIDIEILMNFSTNSIIRAALAVYLLLKNHCCIERLDLVNDAVSRKYPFLLSRGLYFNRGLRHLKVSSAPVPEMFGDDLASAVKRMPTLESLEIREVKLSRNAAGAIAEMMQKNPHLKKVAFMQNDMTELGTLVLLRSLTFCRALETLCIDDSCLDVRGAETLSRLLSTNDTVRELSVKYIANLDDDLFMSIVRPLKVNATLQKIEFSGGLLSINAIAFLAKVLKQNKSLRFLHVIDCNIRHHHANTLSDILEDNRTLLELHLQGNNLRDKGAEALVRGIERNNSLRVLQLDSNKFGPRGIRLIANALTKNRTLQNLVLGHFDCESEDQSRLLTHTLHTTNVLDRMQLSYDESGFVELVRSLRTTKYQTTEVNVDASLDLESERLQELFRVLRTLECLETVIVEAHAFIDDATAARVSKFLAVCQTVKRFHLNTTSAEITAFPILVRGLKRNNSVEHLELEYRAEDGHSALAFFDLLKENSKIGYFSYLKTNSQYLSMLPAEMDTNYTLTTLKVYEEVGFKRPLLDVYEKLRRNVSLVNRAVEFALKPRVDRRMAEAYERLCDVGYLQRRLRETNGMSEDELEASMKAARAFIVEHYLPITRIVKRQLVCYNVVGRTQIDKLDYHVWIHIFSYLRVGDVINA